MFYSPSIDKKYRNAGRARFITDSIRQQPAVDRYLQSARAGNLPWHAYTPDPDGISAAYRHYLRAAWVRELTREVDDFAGTDAELDAYEWLCDILGYILPVSTPAATLLHLLNKYYDGGALAYISDHASWCRHQDSHQESRL